MRLTDDELRDVLERAEESQVARTLRERLNLVAPPAAGDRVFAKSADGKFYVADVVSISGDDVRVRFLRGSEHVVTLDQLRPASFVPGQRVMFDWPWWGPWSCSVITYDQPSQFLKLSDRWGSTTTAHVSDVWLEPERKLDTRNPRTRIYVALLGAGAGVGALIGSILTALVMR